ncbi:MAG: Rrf2 family transcriptional regulator [Rhizobiaceae bacterium]
MRLNRASDYALRILMLLAAEREPVTVDAISVRLKLVKSHLMKIVAKLVKAEILKSNRGRNGGISLGRPAEQITLGEVVRTIEADFAVVECMGSGSRCVFLPGCRLKRVMHDARSAFLAELDGRTLDAITPPGVRPS